MNLPNLSRFEFLPLSPAFGLYPPLPLESRSFAFSRAVPSFKCLGFTHDGLSHVCIMNPPFGTGRACSTSHAATCAGIMRYFHRTLPYPSLSLAPSQIQQSPNWVIPGIDLGSVVSAISLHCSEQYTFRFDPVTNISPHQKHC